ncbi:DnaJ C-terminal domain-containing protein [Tahibacter harae]|uniref:DnaJ domain-containing protein n=1 Tax=Tahibacter harae TaxID=2963937 RepID=A0ABT1QMG3_9GAMM|nr:DnaJ C-terminal domain-containing protein [Tahibacter harae]MCQ4163726.1 DnaJ domain-containing protein [Tahibacter harae]
MQFKDYYDTLGVKPDASESEIKSAFRKLARKYHPDVSKEAGAEDKFKAVNEAYEALRDPDKRREYDALRARGYKPGDEFQPAPDFGGFGGGGFGGGNGGGEGFSDFFESLFGRSGGRAQAGPRRGQDLRAHAAIDLETAFVGGTQRLELNGERLDVTIPAGILPGQTIRLRGKGHPGRNGAPAGDVLLEIQLRPHPRFQLDGRDVTVKLAIAPWDAALGATVKVPTLAGEVDLKIPAGSDSGRKMRLKGRGMPGPETGDQYVVLEVRAPAAHSDAQREAYERLREAFDG